MATRCPDCNKFARLSIGDVSEYDSIRLEDDGNLVGSATVEVQCDDCGMTLKEGTIDIQYDLSHELEGHLEEGHELDLDYDLEDYEADEGKKKLYGYMLDILVTCSCNPEWEYKEQFKEAVPSTDLDDVV